MNLVLKTKVREVNTNITDSNYATDLTKNKIAIKEKYIEDSKNNRDTILSEKTNLISNNQEEIHAVQKKETELQQSTDTFLEAMKGEDVVTTKRDKLKDVQFSLKDKHSRSSNLIKFFEDNDDCPTCFQHIDEEFKCKSIDDKLLEVRELETGLNKLSEEMNKVNKKVKDFKNLATAIQKNQVEIGKYRSTITQLEKFNATLEAEIKQINDQEVAEEDIKKLNNLQEKLDSYESTAKKLKEELFYYDVAKNLLQDTGIKTKIVKQYLPIMNKLINTYLSSMDFFVNFNIDENFNETIKSRFRDDFVYANFSEGEKMRIDLALLFTWRAIAKMKNSTNTNLLILDEIFDSSLDADGTDAFLKILNTFDSENVFVISHKQDMLFDKFRHTVKFEKTRNFSKVV